MLTLLSLLSLAAAPAPVAAPYRENVPTPVVRPPAPPKKKGARFVQRRLSRPGRGEGTPLVFSRSPSPSLRHDGATFTFEPGQPSASSWPGADVAWLVRDLDADGQVTSGRELFGAFTLLQNGEHARNGFEALGELDVNADGLVSGDEATTLRWWFDRNANRRVDAGELEVVNVALPTRFEPVTSCDARGNCVRERVSVEGGWLLDLYLRLDSAAPRVTARESTPRTR